MKRLLTVVCVVGLAGVCWAQDQGIGGLLKSAGKAAVDAGAQTLNAGAKAVVEKASGLQGQAKEDFLTTKAKEFLGAKDYETAMQVATYVKTNVNPKSVSADKIIADAKAALAKYAQDKLNQTQAAGQANQTTQQVNQVKSDAQNVSAGVKNLLGNFKTGDTK